MQSFDGSASTVCRNVCVCVCVLNNYLQVSGRIFASSCHDRSEWLKYFGLQRAIVDVFAVDGQMTTCTFCRFNPESFDWYHLDSSKCQMRSRAKTEQELKEIRSRYSSSNNEEPDYTVRKLRPWCEKAVLSQMGLVGGVYHDEFSYNKR